jgi:soluble lytic murein transglycosylase
LIIPYVHHKAKLPFVVIVLATLLVTSSATSAQTPQQQLRAAIDQGDIPAALGQLRSLRATNPDLFAANNYDYLLGRLQENTGDRAAAASSYQASVTNQSILAEYALWHLAKIAQQSGDLVREREQLRQLVNLAPGSLLREAALMRMGQSYFESQDYQNAALAFRRLGESKNIAIVRESRMWLGQSLIKSANLAEARTVFTRLLMEMPDASRPDDFALASVRALDIMDRGSKTDAGVGELPEAEHLLRASVYHFNRDFDAARLHYATVVARFPQSPTVANALYQMGRGYYLQQSYDEGLKYFQRVLRDFPESTSAKDALSFSAGSYNRLKRTDEAVAAYKLYGEKYLTEPNPERAFLNIIDALHEAGRHKEALDWVAETRVRFRGRIGGALALFAQMRIHLAQGAWQAVVSDANELANAGDLGGARVAGGTTKAEVTFLRAFALEQLGRADEAMTDYLSLPDGRNEYYGKRATQRLQALAADPKTRSLIQSRANSLRAEAERLFDAGKTDDARIAAQNALRLTTDQQRDPVIQLVRRTYDALPAYQLPDFKLLTLGRQGSATAPATDNSHHGVADELFFLGLYDEAAPEFVAAKFGNDAVANKALTKTGTASLSNDDYSIAIYQLRGGHADQAVKFGEQVWKSVPADYLVEVARRDFVELLYPLPYRDSLLRHAPAAGVDPRFVISIARQESRFQPAAKSVAAARGLMQFIAETSNTTAEELGLKDFRQDDLYNADTAILFGSKYLAALFKQFPGQPQAVAASYNGGPENMARWVARSRANEPDRYVPEVGFAQTKDYVFKVMLNYWQYQALYDEKLDRH